MRATERAAERAIANAPAGSRGPVRPEAGEHPFAAVLFDLDGTLVDSTAAVRRAWSAWAREEGLDPREATSMVGRPAREIVGRFVDPERLEASLARYAEHAATTLDGVVPLPGTAEALAATSGRCAVVTSSARAIALARLGRCGLEPSWPMVTADDVTRGKPDPEPFLRGAAALGVAPGRCVAVEDSGAGVASARAAGCHVVAVHHGAGTAGLEAADVLVRDLSALRWPVGPAGGLGVALAGR